jgi:hypothetical protein
MGLVALQLCWASYITFLHHAATRRINSEPKSGDQNGMLPRDSCDKGPRKHPLQYCWPLTISGQAMSYVLIFLLAGPLNEILVFVWYPVIMITIILEYYNVIVGDYQHLHAPITTHRPGRWQPLIDSTRSYQHCTDFLMLTLSLNPQLFWPHCPDLQTLYKKWPPSDKDKVNASTITEYTDVFCSLFADLTLSTRMAVQCPPCYLPASLADCSDLNSPV